MNSITELLNLVHTTAHPVATGCIPELLKNEPSNIQSCRTTEERNAVKYLLSDMYNQYISYLDKYFPNGPIESINRKVKDLKRSGRGYRNFEHFRNRFLYSARQLPVLNGVTDYSLFYI